MRLVRFFALLLALTLVPSVSIAADAAVAEKPVAVKVDAGAVTQPAVKPAVPVVPVTVDESVDTLKDTVKSFTAEHFRAGIAGVICLLVFIWRRFLSGLLIGKIPQKFLPLVTAGVALVAAIPVALAADPWSWKTFIWQGLITGAEAMAFWSLAIKFILPVPEKK